MKNPSVDSIRRRLLFLLLRAYAVILVLNLVLTAVVMLVYIGLATSSSSTFRLPFARLLETFYTGRGSWEGVGEYLSGEQAAGSEGYGIEISHSILLDAENRVLYEHGALVEHTLQVYEPRNHNLIIPLQVDGNQVGTLVFDRGFWFIKYWNSLRLVAPVGVTTFSMALLAFAIGVVLMRRFVSPLAEVIAAAKSVAAGKLETRVAVSGPDDLQALSDSFNQMAASLERNDRERRALLADIAHELRTPLSIIQGRLEGILDGIYPADEKNVSQALEETYLLERLVEDLRLLTLAENQQIQFDMRPVDLRQMAAGLVDDFTLEAKEKGIDITLEAADRAVFVVVDPQRMAQVAGNLVANAIRYTPAGGKVRLVLESYCSETSLAVHDSGPGIPEDDLPYIFERFWRAEKSRSRATGGSGLGLAIARHLTVAMGGQISAHNRPEGGFVVEITLPRETT